MRCYHHFMTGTSSDLSPYLSKIKEAPTLETLDAIQQELFSRKHGVLTLALKELAGLPSEERVRRGQELNAKKEELTAALASRRTALRSAASSSLAQTDPLDVTLDLPPEEHGHLHPIPEFIRKVEEVFGRMGFDVAHGPEVETEDFNFNFLNIPDSHPARDGQDTFWIDHDGEEKYVLRTHTSPVQIRYMRSHTPPFRAIFPGKVFRKDSDATHSPMFHQFEGLMIGKDISLANLKSVLVTAMKELISPNVTFRFRSGYFPFVEPGMEMDMQWQGTAVATAVPGAPGAPETKTFAEHPKEGRWLEMGGCGMVHPHVLRAGGVDPEEWQGFAFGFGVERPLMIKHRIPDLRLFFQNDLRFLRQF